MALLAKISGLITYLENRLRKKKREKKKKKKKKKTEKKTKRKKKRKKRQGLEVKADREMGEGIMGIINLNDFLMWELNR